MRSITEVVRNFKLRWTEELEPAALEKACRDAKMNWINSTLNPVVTIQLFFLQILHGNTACEHLPQLTKLPFTAAAYCKARMRLKLQALYLLLERSVAQLHQDVLDGSRWLGHRVFFVDGSGFSMPDTPQLREHFGQPGGQHEGCGFPVAHWLAMMHAGSGMIMKMLASPLRTHDMSKTVHLHDELQPGDVLVADRAFCSFVHLVLVVQRGVHAVLRIHQRTIVDFTPGRPHVEPRRGKSDRGKGLPRSRWLRSLGVTDQVVQWLKPASRPTWISREQFAALAEYEYDGAKRRSIKEIYASGVLDETRHYFYTEPSKWQVVEERVESSSDAERQFVWGLRYDDDIIERVRDTDTNGTLDERLYGIQDANWSLTCIVAIDGVIQERYGYDAYGVSTVLTSAFSQRSSSNFNWNERYAGYRYEVESDLYCVRHRNYHPLMSWLQRDAVGYTSASLNLYEYAQANPVLYVDPTGKWILPAICAAGCVGCLGPIAIGWGTCAAVTDNEDDFWTCIDAYVQSLSTAWYAFLHGLACGTCIGCTIRYAWPLLVRLFWVARCKIVDLIFNKTLMCTIALACYVGRMTGIIPPWWWPVVRQPCKLATALCFAGAAAGV